VTRSRCFAAVIGIDFGTGGYAIGIGYKYRGSSWIVDHETIQHGHVYKNSAALLGRAEFNTRRYAEGDIEFHQLGYNALSTFADIAQEERGGFVLFPSAKMSLYKMDEAEALAKAVNGATAPAADIIRMALAQIHSEARRGVSSLGDVLWVITVPAIWSDAAKQIMREAAIKAGIPDQQLIFALEPEAASIACRVGPGPEFDVQPLDTRSSYMVVDAGKGTVDITVHQMQNDRLSDITIPRGGDCGSGNVDTRFEMLLNDCFTSAAVDDFKNAMPNEWLEIMRRFELVKCRGNIDKFKTVHLDLGQKFLFHVGNAVEEPAKVKIPEGVSINEQFASLDLSHEAFYRLFKPSLDRIYELISQSLSDPNVRDSCKTLFLVGGYGSCPFVKEITHRAINDAGLKIEVIRPLEPALAVVKGAIMYGLDPDILSARMSQRTIAVAVSVPFDPAVHSGMKSVEIDGKTFCTDALDVLVKRGQKIKSREIIEHVYSPLIPDRRVQSVSVVRIYHSPKEDIKYVGEENVQLAGSTNNDSED
jgi:hypothetical protein